MSALMVPNTSTASIYKNGESFQERQYVYQSKNMKPPYVSCLLGPDLNI